MFHFAQGRMDNGAHQLGPFPLGFPKPKYQNTDSSSSAYHTHQLVKRTNKKKLQTKQMESFFYHNGVTKKVLEIVLESAHEVCVTLDRRSAFKNRKGVASQ